MKLIARTFAGLEEILEKELISIGAKDTILRKRAVEFHGNQEMMYKVNFWSRLALDILTPIHRFEARSPEELYDKVKEVEWSKYLSPESTFAINGIIYSSHFTHSQFATLKMKDAIVDQIRDNTGDRPDVDTYSPDLRITLRISEHKCEILLNSSGAPLFKRGYRKSIGLAPLNEVLAAGLIALSDWDKKKPFIDPMCGSGTIPIEAAMVARNMAPGLVRNEFGFQKWHNYDRDLYEKVYADAEKAMVESRVLIKGYDIDFDMVKSAKFNLRNVPEISRMVQIEKQDFFTSEKPFNKVHIICNPPYDKRIELIDAETFYDKIGTQLKHKFVDCDAFILSSNLDAIKRISLKPTKKHTLYNGPDESKFIHFQMYQGKKSEFNARTRD
jgi:putative N6-adenine-specific DNA methylase